MTIIPIFLSSDDKFTPFLVVTMTSICYNTQHFINFYILDSNIKVFNKNRIKNLTKKFKNCTIEFIKIDIDKYFSNFKTNKQWNINTYFRFLIPELKNNIDKVIYLDCDIIVLDDIIKLYNENLGDKIIGAVPEYHYTTFTLLNNVKNKCNIDCKHKYFNAGVMLINCEKWRQNDITKKLFKIEKKYRDKLMFLDQDVLNKCFECDYKELHIKYNVMHSGGDIIDKFDIAIRNIIKNMNDNIVIRHFAGITKPWKNCYYGNSKKYVDCFNEFWFFAEMTDFCGGLREEFVAGLVNNNVKTFKFKILGVCLFLIKNNVVYLFGVVPVMRWKIQNCYK